MNTHNNNFLCQISHITYRLNYYTKVFFSTPKPWEKMYYVNLISNELFWLNSLTQQLGEYFAEPNNTIEEKQFTLTELANYTGTNGTPAYAAVNGIVYDLSLEETWGGGSHFGLIAGKDLTSQFKRCHQAETILNNLPVVGVLI